MAAPAGPARRSVRALLLAAFLVVSAGGAAVSSAEEGPAEAAPSERSVEAGMEDPPSERPVGPAIEAAPPEGLVGKGVEAIEKGVGAAAGAMDVTHASVQRNILGRVIWFDEFFGNVRTEDARQPEYVLRWVNSFRFEEGGAIRFRTSVRANLRLPKLGERLRLVISGENEADPAASLPEDPGNPGFDQTLPDTRLVNAEIRYTMFQRPAVHLFLGAGVRLVLPPEIFIRTRAQYTRRLSDVSLARFGETLFWKDREGFGETTEVDFERQVGQRTLLRWANAGTFSQRSEGLEWGTELSLQRELSTRDAVTLAGGIAGDTRPSAQAEVYRIFTRYRRNVLRTWLFVELEPEISWPRTDGGGYPAAFAFTFRIESLFQGSGAAMDTQPPRGQ